MKIFSFEYIRNTLLIGISFILLKSFNLILPYFLDSASYNEFNKIFYYSSLLTTISTFGFTYAITQVNFTPIIISILVLFNTVLAFIFINIFSGLNTSFYQSSLIIVISFTTTLFSIYNFQLLFNSKTSQYFITVVIISAGYFLSIALFHLFKLDVILSYAILGFLGLILCFKYFEIGTVRDFKQANKLYKIGGGTFVINSAAGIVLMADKFIANNTFNIELANAYTYSWTLIAPLFYLGNIAERNIYASEGKRSLKSAIFNSIILITLGVIFYFIALVILTNFFTQYLPKAIDTDMMKTIIFTMFFGYVFYIFLHFPLNGILFKFNLHKVQKVTALAYLALFTVAGVIYKSNFISFSSNDYLTLFEVVISFLLILSVTKLATIFLMRKRVVLDFLKSN